MDTTEITRTIIRFVVSIFSKYLLRFPQNQTSLHMDYNLQVAIVLGRQQNVRNLYRRGVDVNVYTLDGFSAVHLALKNGRYKIAAYLLKLGSDPHAASTHSEYKGYTVLHFACLKNKQTLVEKLLLTFHVNPSAMAADGVQPIHLAAFHGKIEIVKLLLAASVTVETKVDKAVFKEYHEGISWCNDFGDRITLLTYAVLYNRVDLAVLLLESGADLRIKNSDNQTLLMCAARNECYRIVRKMVPRLTKEEINDRDSAGFAATHYILKGKKIISDPLSLTNFNDHDRLPRRAEILNSLIEAGADINLLANGDPSTLLINMAACWSQPFMLALLLPIQNYSPIARPLLYATLSNREANDLSLVIPDRIDIWGFDINETIVNLDLLYPIYIITKHLNKRINLGLPVLREEINRLEEMSRTPHISFTFGNDSQKIFDGLKQEIVNFGDEKISVCEVLKKSNRELKKLARNKEFVEAFKDYNVVPANGDTFLMIQKHVEQTVERLELIEKLKNTLFPVDSIFYYIPFDCTLEIVEYLHNYYLNNFVQAWC